MTHPDARTLKPAAQAEKRRIAMTMGEAGSRFSEIGSALGVHYRMVSKWWDRDQDGGAEALAYSGGITTPPSAMRSWIVWSTTRTVSPLPEAPCANSAPPPCPTPRRRNDPHRSRAPSITPSPPTPRPKWTGRPGRIEPERLAELNRIITLASKQ
jgi:hypothetical protein